jgi:fumarate reductase flavoprotein subunit
VLLERDALPSGSTALSSGFIPRPARHAARAWRASTTAPERFAADIQAKAHGRAAPHLVEAYTQSHRAGARCAAAAARLAVRCCSTAFSIRGTACAACTRCREDRRALMAALERRGGRGHSRADEALVASCASMPKTAWSASATAGPTAAGELALRRAAARLQRLRRQRGDGRELLPEMADATFGGHAGNDGSAILWGESLGARLRDLGGYQGHGSWVTPQGALMTWAVMMEGGVQLNCEGRRFHDETQGYSEAAVHVLAAAGRHRVERVRCAAARAGARLPDFLRGRSGRLCACARSRRGGLHRLLAAVIG